MSRCSITSIREDPRSLTTYLAAQPAGWRDFAGSYELEYKHFMVDPTRLQKRNNWLLGNIEIEKEHDFRFVVGHPGKKFNIWHDDT